jgi:hypothetical protein
MPNTSIRGKIDIKKADYVVGFGEVSAFIFE